MEITIPIKPFSTNQMWKFNSKTGRPYKTPQYNEYIKKVRECLPHQEVLITKPIGIEYEFLLTHTQDLDNLLKPFNDALEGVIFANDSQIRKIIATKRKSSNCEIKIKISVLEDDN